MIMNNKTKWMEENKVKLKNKWNVKQKYKINLNNDSTKYKNLWDDNSRK